MNDAGDEDSGFERTVNTTLGEYGDGSAKEMLENWASEELGCLICLETIERKEAVWSCRECYNIYHLPCIQQWVREGVNFKSDTDTAQQDWYCPKCRHAYEQRECPVKYKCYCGRTPDPVDDPWLLAHSCGAKCNRSLPNCPHRCLLLCHPGRCPPCPVTIAVPCYGKHGKTTQTQRCSTAGWSCGQSCGHILACKVHRCAEKCHEGECSPCEEWAVRRCVCGKESRETSCANEAQWTCTRECGKSLNCSGGHTCGQICHTGQCLPCVPPGCRTCPCGKVEYKELSCIDDQPCCGDTCDRILECGEHRCVERCHRSACPPCRELVTVRCACGMKEVQTECWKRAEAKCEAKCKRLRSCGKHACNRKCCDGRACSSCDKVCMAMKSCKKHRCDAPCHTGRCYPCPLKVEVKCACGRTVIRVPCGRERTARPPRCTLQCTKPPVCHHPTARPHRCHFERCPNCTQPCDKPRQCGHSCKAKCHTAVWTDVSEKKKAATPWEKVAPKFEHVEQPCPPCRDPVPVTCLGGHETLEVPCCEAKRRSCGRECGRALPCGNHACKMTCHSLDQPCDDCNSMCTRPRPQGCTHRCVKACHADPCPVCPQMVKEECHCGLAKRFIECPKWVSASSEDRIQLLTCGEQCPVLMDCGHRCTRTCHPKTEECSPSSECTKKVTKRCPCKRQKTTTECNLSASVVMNCDDVCAVEKNSKQLNTQFSKSKEQEIAEELKQKEQEALQRRFGGAGKRTKRKRTKSDTVELTFLERNKFRLIFGCGLCLTACVLAYFIY